MFNCCKYRVDITKKNIAKRLQNSSSKASNIFLCEYLKSLQNKFFAWNHNQFALFDSSVTQSKVMYNQSSSQSPACSRSTHAIIACDRIVYFPLHIMNFLTCIFVSYTISSMAKICAFYETYIIIVARVDTFDCSLFFWRELLTGCPEALDFETFREEPLWRTYQKFSRAFFSLCF